MKKRLLSLILCLACFLLASCGRNAENATVTTDENRTTVETTTEAPEPVPDYDLTQVEATHILDFMNGRAWLQFINNGQYETVSVDNKGVKQFSISGTVVYASPFVDGTAFLVFYDGQDKKDSRITFYHETIVDLQGNELYSTSIADTDKDKHEEHILAYGEGKFVVLRNVADIYNNVWMLGTIDAHGKTIDEFKPYTYDYEESYLGDYTVADDLIPEWDKYDRRNLRIVYDRMTFNKLGNLDNADIPEYLGEGAFYVTNSVVYHPSKGTISILSKDNFRGSASNGYVISLGSAPSTWYRNSLNKRESERIFDKSVSSSAYLNDFGMKNGMVFHDHGYYDVFGNEIIHVKGFDEQHIFCTPFSDGYALMTINGADGNTYVTMIDSNGTSQFEPFKTDWLSERIDGGYFVSRYDGTVKVYNHNGEAVMDIPVDEHERYYYISEGFVRITCLGLDDCLMKIPEQESDDVPMPPDGSLVQEMSDGKWALVNNGTVVTGFTGISTNRYGSWYVKEGYVDFSANGDIKFNGRTYSVSKGRVNNY